MRKQDRPIVIWLLTGCFLIFIMVAIGGLTRLTHSGLSMVEWNLFMGSVPPTSEADWNELFDKYKQYPEYQMVNFNISLDEFKSIFFWEYGHRMFGRLIGLVFIIPFLWFWIKGMISRSLMPRLLIILALGAFQGFLGYWMVESGLVKDPDVSHYRLAMHLTTAFLTFAYTFWVALGLIYPKSEIRNQKSENGIIEENVRTRSSASAFHSKGLSIEHQKTKSEIGNQKSENGIIEENVRTRSSASDLHSKGLSIEHQKTKSEIGNQKSEMQASSSSSRRQAGAASSSSIYKWIQTLLIVLVIQIIWGAYVAGLNAGKVYNSWPKMGEDWIADGVTAMQPWWQNLVEGIAGVQFVHRYLAYVVVGLVLYIFFKGRKFDLSNSQRQGLRFLLAAVSFQFVLGIFTLLYAVPISLGLLHQLGAFILLGSVVYAMHRFQVDLRRFS